MTRTTRNAAAASMACISIIATLSACGTVPDNAAGAAASGYLPCIVSDSGGFEDRSFNQLGLEGVKEAAKALGSDFKSVQSKTENDYVANITNLINSGCDIIIGSGFNLVASIEDAATANPGTNFAMIDDNSIDLPNVKPVVYETSEAAFLGGYAAASYSKNGVVAAYGGAQYPSVTLYMDGIAAGIEYYNKMKKADVQLLGWDASAQSGTFVGNFTDQNASKTIAQNFLDQKADVLFPVGGPLYQGAAAAVNASGSDAVLEGVDADLYETDTSGYNGLFLTSVMKEIRPTVAAVIEQAAGEKVFDNTAYIGDLRNDGVALAPFHDYVKRVSSTLTDELAAVSAGIIDGSILVPSPGTLK